MILTLILACDRKSPIEEDFAYNALSQSWERIIELSRQEPDGALFQESVILKESTLYVALAEARDTQVVTADGRFVRSLEGTSFGETVTLL